MTSIGAHARNRERALFEIDLVHAPSPFQLRIVSKIVFEANRFGKRPFAVFPRLVFEIESPVEVRADGNVAHLGGRSVATDRTEGKHREGQRLVPMAPAGRIGAILANRGCAVDMIEADQFPADVMRRRFRRKFAGLQLIPKELFVPAVRAKGLGKRYLRNDG